jgi:hypothetical protein
MSQVNFLELNEIFYTMLTPYLFNFGSSIPSFFLHFLFGIKDPSFAYGVAGSNIGIVVEVRLQFTDLARP